MEFSVMGVHQAKTFRNRGSVALRLPERLCIAPGESFLIETEGDRLTVSRLPDRKQTVRKLRALLPVLQAIGARGTSHFPAAKGRP
jgi:virulence-associated protein VagC